MTARKKLIEVAMPLDVISEASVREKSIRHGHPSTLHLWWSRKPLATSRAVLFASLVDDPSEHPEQFPGEHEQEQERLRLFRLMEDLITWENSNKPDILAQAQAEIHKSANGTLPPFLDPFAGGGSIPLEAQRLGLESHASDLNPVAVLLNKALIEIPPRFTGRAPVNPDARKSLLAEDWLAAHGLAADIRYYGRWLRAEAEKKIGHLYPKAKLSDGSEASVIAWLWVRTVTCPNPACGAQMPLTSKWWLSKKKGKEAWIKPEVDPIKGTIDFVVCMGSPDKVVAKDIDRGTSAVDKQGKKTKATFECVTCHDGVVKGEYIDIEANAGRMNCMPIAVVAEGVHNRVYLSVNNEQMREQQRQSLQLLNMPEMQSKIPSEPARGTFASNAQGRIYGFKTFADYFSPRQLVALITFSDLIQEVRECVLNDAIAAGLPDDDVALNAGGSGARAYAESIGVYLSLAVDRLADRNSTICSWDTGYVKVRNTFARQAIPMVWDYAEANPFSDSTGNFVGAVDWVAEAVEATPVQVAGSAMQR
ncbi:MAG TPA: DUF1156 domain-containing protein, partial [Ktedonobacteraceae bacterium]|nr:DUF1156 domain-containing protein [Ktedonobacteraceae bacterium]